LKNIISYRFLNIDNKISLLPKSVTLHLHHSNKQQLILTKFYTNNAQFIDHQTARFYLNLPKQTIATAAFVRSAKHFSFGSLWITLDTKTWNWSVLGWPCKSRCSYCLFQ